MISVLVALSLNMDPLSTVTRMRVTAGVNRSNSISMVRSNAVPSMRHPNFAFLSAVTLICIRFKVLSVAVLRSFIGVVNVL